MLDFIIITILVILLIGFLGGSIIIKREDNKDINLNEEINKVADKIKDKINNKKE